ncbi:MAG: ABC transporter ATP-binding protein [Actinomycetota bacterium]|nr:ABC transporter ATP-binding protein [Actinomycetota bacterium]
MRGVSKAYHNPSETNAVFRDVDLELHRGEITSLVGPSGSGKSTIISLIAGLMVPDAGQLVFDGRDVAELSDAERSNLRAKRIGTVLQSGNLLPFLTASENVAMAIRLAGSRSSPKRVASLLNQVGLPDRADHLPRRLSGGESQRVALAVALANEPDLLLADEVVGQLDSTTARLVMEALRKACCEQGLTVLLVTHSQEVAAIGSHIVRLVEGRLEKAS